MTASRLDHLEKQVGQLINLTTTALKTLKSHIELLEQRADADREVVNALTDDVAHLNRNLMRLAGDVSRATGISA